jgi:phenylacetic acid degradation operon negative regulatory protein
MPTTNRSLRAHLNTLIQEDLPRAKSLCVTVLGDEVGPHGGVAWLGDLIALLEPLGINERLLRTSVFRLVAQGWLKSEREGRRSRYALADQGIKLTARASGRIYVGPPIEWDDSWTIVILPRVGSHGLAERTALKNQLVWEGFGVLAPGVFAHPHADARVAHEILEKLGIPDLALVLHANDNPASTGLPIASLANQCWNLDALSIQYQRFYERFAPFEQLIGPEIEPELAHMLRALLVHAWRRVVLHDPQLPAAMLPARWPGQTARTLCERLYWRLFAGSEHYLQERLKPENPQHQPIADSVFTRFGGAPESVIMAVRQQRHLA